jgi:hypothetical protein
LKAKKKFQQAGIIVKEQLPKELQDLKQKLRFAAEKEFGPLGDGSSGTVKLIHGIDHIKVGRDRFWLGGDGKLSPRPNFNDRFALTVEPPGRVEQMEVDRDEQRRKRTRDLSTSGVSPVNKKTGSG